MTRKGWDSLSEPVRRRYQRNGVSRADYESGVSLSAARGHAQTPERKERAERNPDRYREYLRRRNSGMRVVTSEGTITVYGMGAAERSIVGKHANAVHKELISEPGRRRSTVKVRRGDKVMQLPEFRNMRVTGYREQKTGSLEEFELETDPSALGRFAFLGLLDFESIYDDSSNTRAVAS